MARILPPKQNPHRSPKSAVIDIKNRSYLPYESTFCYAVLAKNYLINSREAESEYRASAASRKRHTARRGRAVNFMIGLDLSATAEMTILNIHNVLLLIRPK